MTNDFSVEQKRPSAAPYTLGGMAVGALVGSQLPTWTGKPKTVDQLIEDMNNKDEFTKNTAEGAEHATEWKDLKAQAEKVKAAEKAAEEASKPQLTSGKELDELNTAKKNFEDKMKELQAIEDKKAGVTRTKSDFPSYSEIKSFDYYNKNGGYGEVMDYKTGNHYSGLKPSAAKDYFDEYTNELKKAESKLDSILAPDKALLNTERSTVEDVFQLCLNDTKGKSFEEIEDYFKGEKSKGYEKAESYADTMFGTEKAIKKSELPNSEFKKLNMLDKLPEGAKERDYVSRTFEVQNPKTGFIQDVKYWVPEDEYESARATYRKEMLAARENTINVMTDLSKKHCELNRQLSNLYESTAKNDLKVSYDTAIDAGIKLTSRSEHPKASDIENIVTVAVKRPDLKNKADVVIKTGYAADVERLAPLAGKENMAAELTKHGVAPDIIADMKNFYGDVTVEEARKKANACKKIYTTYDAEKTRINEELKKLVDQNPRVKVVAERIEETKAGDAGKGVRAAREKLAKTFPKIFGKYGKEEVTSGTAKIIEDSDSRLESLRKIVEDKQKLYDEAVAKNGGKIDEAAKKVADDALNKERETFTKMGEELSGKIGKVPGMKKVWGYVIGIAALGLVGLGIGKAVNKNKNA